MFRRFFPFAVLLILLALSVSACAPAAPVCGSQMATGGEYENVCGFEVPKDARTASLYMQVKLRQGRVQWTLENPHGEVIWRGFADSTTPVDKSATIEAPMPGMWSLHIETYKAIGEYSAPWLVQ